MRCCHGAPMSPSGEVTTTTTYGRSWLSSELAVPPYRVGHPMTRHVNPDKLYHYLNAGLEVLAAPIPQMQRHANNVHLITTDGPWTATLDAVVNAPRRGDWSAENNSWDRRWHELKQAVAQPRRSAVSSEPDRNRTTPTRRNFTGMMLPIPSIDTSLPVPTR